MACDCGPQWTVESFDLKTGRVLGVLNPTAIDAQTLLNDIGAGTLSLSARDVPARLVWPRLVGIGIIWQDTPVWIGWVETVEMSSDSTLRVGVIPLDGYMFQRHIDETVEWPGVSQTAAPANLVNRFCDGIALSAVSEPSQFNNRTRRFYWYDHHVVGELVQNLTEVINGPDWELVPSRSAAGVWHGTIIFRDSVGVERPFTLLSGRDSGNYGITVDAGDMGTHQHAVGDGQDEEQIEEYAEDLSVYPRFDTVTGFSSVTSRQTLREHATGRVNLFGEPAAIPSMVLDGANPPPDQLGVGDIANVDIDHALWAYRGAARVLGLTYKGSADAADQRSLMFSPLQRASQTILVQQPTGRCVDC